MVPEPFRAIYEPNYEAFNSKLEKERCAHNQFLLAAAATQCTRGIDLLQQKTARSSDPAAPQTQSLQSQASGR
jgi:hypothetical protein